MYQPPEKALSESLGEVVDHASDLRAILMLMSDSFNASYQQLREAIGTDKAYSLMTSTRLAIKLVDSLESATEKIDCTLFANQNQQN